MRGGRRLPAGPTPRGGSLRRIPLPLAARGDHGHGAPRAPSLGGRDLRAQRASEWGERLSRRWLGRPADRPMRLRLALAVTRSARAASRRASSDRPVPFAVSVATRVDMRLSLTLATRQLAGGDAGPSATRRARRGGAGADLSQRLLARRERAASVAPSFSSRAMRGAELSAPHAQSALSFAAPPVPRVVRRAAPPPHVEPTPARPATATPRAIVAAPSLADAPPHDVERLAERVMQTLDRRMTAFRERRGRG